MYLWCTVPPVVWRLTSITLVMVGLEGQIEACWTPVALRCSVPELDAAEGIACQLGCGRHTARVPCLPGGNVIGAIMLR